jgi:hypothetical protein
MFWRSFLIPSGRSRGRLLCGKLSRRSPPAATTQPARTCRSQFLDDNCDNGIGSTDAMMIHARRFAAPKPTTQPCAITLKRGASDSRQSA